MPPGTGGHHLPDRWGHWAVSTGRRVGMRKSGLSIRVWVLVGVRIGVQASVRAGV